MKLSFIISNLGNKFQFIQTLTEWHHSMRVWDKENWIEKTGELNQEEENALLNFEKILKKYSFDSNPSLNEGIFVGKVFFFSDENNIWDNLMKWTTKEEAEQIKEVFELFNQRFEIIWQEEEENLKIRREFLDKNIYGNENFNILQEKIRNFL